MKKKFNENKILFLLVIVIISVISIGLSFAYFAAQISSPANTNVDIGSEVSEKLIFTPGNEFNLQANQNNFGEGDGSISDSVTSNATLIANSTVGSATDVYQVYLEISVNNFIYTVDANTPELILTVIDPDGNEVTALDGLSYKTVIDAATNETIKGFDITTFEGLVVIKEDKSISTTSSTSGTKEDWTVEITFVNLDTNQSSNEGKSLEANFILQKEKMVNPAVPYSCYNNIDTTGLPDPETVYDYYLDDYSNTAVIKSLLYTEYNPETLIVPCFIEGHQVDRLDIFALDYNSASTKIYLPEGLTTLPWYAIDISGLKEIVLPHSLKNIDDNAILSYSLPIDSNKFILSSPEGAVWVLDYVGFDAPENIVVPSNVIGISEHAFSRSTGNTSISLPNGLKYINSDAFSTLNLSDIVIPSSVVSIGSNVIKSGTIPYTADNLVLSSSSGAVWVLDSNDSNTSVSVPSNVIGISGNGLTASYTNITLPNGLLYLDDYALADNNLTSINIPNTVKTFGLGILNRNSFSGDSAFIYNINEDGSTNYESLNGYASKTAANVIIPNGVLNIGESAFNNSNVGNIDLNNVISIEMEAFRGNQSIELQNNFPSSLKTIHLYGFVDIPKYDIYDQDESSILPSNVTEYAVKIFGNFPSSG